MQLRRIWNALVLQLLEYCLTGMISVDGTSHSWQPKSQLAAVSSQWQPESRLALDDSVPSHLDIEVTSGRLEMTVGVNNSVIFSSKTENSDRVAEDESQSLHFFVLSQHTGRLLTKRAFNTTAHSNSMALHPFLESLANGRILVAGIKTDAALNLPQVTRNFLLKLGLSSVSYLQYRNYMAAILIIGERTLAEAMVLDDMTVENGVFASPLMLQASIRLMPHSTCPWFFLQSKRTVFCSYYDGYGDICDCSCERPTMLNWSPKTLADNNLEETPLLIIAGNRPSSLYRCLHTLLSQPGASLTRILVSIDGHHKEVTSLLELLQVKYVENLSKRELNINSTSFRISKHYIFSLENVFRIFPNASDAILLEEDLLASPDFLSYFSQTAWLLASDPSLYCISAWNDMGALHASRDRTKLLRVETHPGYGWMLTKQFFEEVKQEWKNIENDHDWDIWFRAPHVRLARECVIPAVSRTFHYGSTGAHVNSVLTLAHFMGHLASAHHDVQFDTWSLQEAEYERKLYDILTDKNTVFMNSKLHPCYDSFLPKNLTDGPLVVAFEMLTAEDYTSWTRLGGCNGLWHMDTRGHHRGLFEFGYYNTTLYAIGYPFSDYSWLVPPHVHVVRSLTSKAEKNALSRLVLNNRRRFRVPDLEPYAPAILREVAIPTPLYKDPDGRIF